MRERAKVCQCGTRAEEWDANPHAYVAVTERCPGCELLAQEDANIPENALGVRKLLVHPDDPRARMKTDG